MPTCLDTRVHAASQSNRRELLASTMTNASDLGQKIATWRPRIPPIDELLNFITHGESGIRGVAPSNVGALAFVPLKKRGTIKCTLGAGFFMLKI